MVNVVDVRMGCGKTSAAIQYMNDHPEKRYLFITPFIDETERIRKACPELNFATPSGKIKEFSFRKINHLKELVDDGRNVALSHELYTRCDRDTAKTIAERGYVVFIDEVIEMLSLATLKDDDVDIAVTYGLLISTGREPGEWVKYSCNPDREYRGVVFRDILECASSHDIIRLENDGIQERYYYWTIHEELLRLASEIYILTYMFDGMPMKAMLDINKIPYRYIGVQMDDNGKYHFTDRPVRDYDPTLREKIHICENERMNSIGDKKTALSSTWTKKARYEDGGENLDTLRKNLANFFRYYAGPDHESKDRLWCTFKEAVGAVRAKGFYNSHLVWTARATNDYSSRSALAYCVNIYLHPYESFYFKACGAEIDADKYALANMVQWLWRGCIRNGEEMWVYVPSKRMRDLLVQWLDSLAEGGDDDGDTAGVQELLVG